LSQINTASVPVVLKIDAPTQMEPSFVMKNISFGSGTLVIYCPQKPVIKMRSSLVIA
jgi:hypothetical protein